MFRIAAAAALVSAPLFAQSLDPKLVGSAGGSHNSAGLNVEWSVGEAVIGPFGGTGNITFGYHQLEDVPTPIVAPEAGLSKLRLKRTPGMIRIRFAEAQVGYEIRMYDSQGRSLRNYSVAKGEKELSIPTRNLGAGTVFLNIHTEDKKLVQGFKLVGE